MFKRILAAVDFSDNSNFVSARAAELCASLDASLRLLHVEPLQAGDLVYDPGSPEERERLSNSPGGERFTLEALCAVARKSGATQVDYATATGNPTEQILIAAEEFQADLIVVGSHGHGKLYHFLAGSTRENLVSQSTIPLLVFRKPL